MTGYEDYTNKDIHEIYKTSMEYSGSINENLQAELCNRGGIDSLLKKIREEYRIPDEIKRISQKIFEFREASYDLPAIKKMISSEILSPKELDSIIQEKYNAIEFFVKDRKITKKTITGCIVGIVFSVIINTYCLDLLADHSKGIIHPTLLLPLQIVDLIIIWALTRQTKRNALVFISAFFALFISYFIWLVLLVAH